MKIYRYFLVIALAGLVSACAKDDNKQSKDGKEASVPTQVRLSLKFNAGTRALDNTEENGEPAENAVNMVEFYVFDADGDIDPLVGTGNGYIKFTDGQLSKLVIVGSGARQFVALTNMDMGPLASGEGYDELKAKMSNSAFTKANSRTTPGADGFEMSGEKEAIVIANSTANTVSIDLLRLVSKINPPTFMKDETTPVELKLSDSHIQKLWGEDTDITNADLTFNPLGYVVVNGMDLSGLFFTGNDDEDDTTPKDVPWDKWSDGARQHLNSEFDADGYYTSNYSGYDAAGDFFLNFNDTSNAQDRVYVYENKPFLKTTPEGQTGFDPLATYAFIIKGELVVDGDTANTNDMNKIRYWRVDIVRDDNYHVMRNASYHINITAIATPGQGTPKDAETTPEIIPGVDESAITIELNVKKWRINFYQDEM